MITVGRDIHEDLRLSCDVVVVGTGCGACPLAARLVAQGHDVVMLERGGYYTSADFDQRELNMLAKIDGERGFGASDDISVSFTYGNNVGGASVHYWADSYRTPPDRLALWRDRYGMEGHAESVLVPHFAVIERDLNVHLADEPRTNRMNELLKQGADALGWEVRRVPQARLNCVGSGYCMQGCAYDAKQSQLVTYLRAASEGGARVYADCRVDEVRFEGSRAAGVSARVLDRATGRPRAQRVHADARVVVIAAGGYGTPELLLRQGLKERLPALGEHFFCNPCPQTGALFEEEIVQWRNIPAAWGVEEFRLAREGEGGYQEGGYLLMANQLHPAMLAAMLPGRGRRMRHWMRNLPKLGGLISWIDDVERGQVRLEGEVRKISYPLTGDNALRIRDAWKKQARCLLEVGAREVRFGDAADTAIRSPSEIEGAVAAIDLRPGRNVLAAPHPGGAARMGDDPATSVTGFDHRVHGTDNLYVSCPSVFPSPPSLDPSLTIMAFSMVAADAIHSALG